MSFHNEVSKCGRVKAGDVIRACPPGSAFGDAVVLGFNERGDMLTSRPYAYASNVGTTGPTVLTGAESITYAASEIAFYFASGHIVESGGHRRV